MGMSNERPKRARAAVAAAGASVLIAGLGVASASPAQASPWNCPVSGSGVSRSTLCLNGAGSYRIAIQCRNIYTGLWSKDVYGPWIQMTESKPSVGWCDWWYESVMNAWAQTIN